MEIEVPPDMDKDTANRCFLMGLQIMLELHKGGLILSSKDKDKIKHFAFFNEDAKAIDKFSDCIFEFQKLNDDEKKENLIKKGEEILKEQVK